MIWLAAFLSCCILIIALIPLAVLVGEFLREIVADFEGDYELPVPLVKQLGRLAEQQRKAKP